MSRPWNEIQRDINEDESLVGPYRVDSPLIGPDGKRVENAFQWENFRRPAILEMYRRMVYGQMPPRPQLVRYELLSQRDDALENTAVRKEIRIHFGMADGRTHFMDLLLYVPRQADRPVPVFLGLCFKSIHCTTDEKDVRITGTLLPGNKDCCEESRGCQEHRWNYRENIRRGYASATVCYHDIFPDCPDGWDSSIYKLFYDRPSDPAVHARHSSIGAWAWGLSRALDCLESLPEIDSGKVILHGHSRLGKTALWAGANDLRFRLVVSNCSGCGGASQFKRNFGENVEAILAVVPHWFVRSFSQYIRNEQAMPFDQHFLISLMAPRPVAVASASEDLWADPKGEFLSCVRASEVYRLFGARGLNECPMPGPDGRISGEISYHLRRGKHDQTPFDWQHYLDLADRFLLKNNSSAGGIE